MVVICILIFPFMLLGELMKMNNPEMKDLSEE